MRTSTRLAAAGAGGGIAILLLAIPARAHVYLEETEVPAGGFTQATVTVPHGCEESPTTKLEIQVPETILDVTPEFVPGWTAEVTPEPLDEPVTGAHGEEFTEREAIVTYTASAGSELPADQRLSFTIGFQAPDTPGEMLYFPTVQSCVEGETAWITNWDGEGEEPETPSPMVAVVAAEGGHGAEEEEGATEEEMTTTSDTNESAASTSDDNDDSSSGLAIAALAAGILGVVLGGTALVRTRRTSA
jgi:uncharacterized protein YcnI